MKMIKAQSAMEYLMTYGWAILIISIVLAALFALGIFSGSTLPNTCIPQAGFTCSLPVYSHTTGNVVISVGQTSQSTWVSANFIFMNSTTLSTFEANGAFPANTPGNFFVANLFSGGTTTITLPVSSVPTGLGSAVTGQVWARYQVSTGGTFYYAEIGILTAKTV